MNPLPPSHTATNAITIRNLSKVYASKKASPKQALDSIQLEIPKGSFFGLLGPNGAGKSTLINILAGLTVKSSGNVIINGVDLDVSPQEAKYAIGVVPQEVILDPFFTVREALELHAGYYGIPPKKRHTQVIIDALGLTDKADAKARSLSGGMRRRLLIGKALVHNPPIIVLDEPTAGVDVQLREQLWNYIKALNHAGTTILLTTHYLEEAEHLCDHIAIINHGKVIACDTKQHLMGKLDQKDIILKFSVPLEQIPAALQLFNPQLTPEGYVSIRYRKNHFSINTVLQIVTEIGLTLQDISTQEPDLEDIFRYLTSQTATQ